MVKVDGVYYSSVPGQEGDMPVPRVRMVPVVIARILVVDMLDGGTVLAVCR